MTADARMSPRDVEVLRFERQWWKHAGAKERAISETFGMTAISYYQLLNGLLDDPAALEHDPALVRRLQRQRARRLAAAKRRLGQATG